MLTLVQGDAALCCSFGVGSNLLACGVGEADAEPGTITGKDRVVFYDLKGAGSSKGGKLGEYKDVHSDLINKVSST